MTNLCTLPIELRHRILSITIRAQVPDRPMIGSSSYESSINKHEGYVEFYDKNPVAKNLALICKSLLYDLRLALADEVKTSEREFRFCREAAWQGRRQDFKNSIFVYASRQSNWEIYAAQDKAVGRERRLTSADVKLWAISEAKDSIERAIKIVEGGA